MILNDSLIQNEVLFDPQTTINMELDQSNMKVLQMILSQGLYSDGVGSLIREYTTNALDAQRESGNKEPIKVSLVKENSQFVFIVKDKGVGLSPERVQNVFSKYCASTKRDSADQLGYFGLGSKAGLSYSDFFKIISVYDSKIYTFTMFKSEEGTSLSLDDISDTNESNGVTIKVYLKEEDDYEVFLEKIRNQLCYFEGVFFETEYDDIDNDFKIIKTDDWKYSELNTDNHMHLCLDNVYYPIDFEKLKIEPIKMPIGIPLSLKDNIMPTPNRESIIYTPHVKELILAKIKAIGEYFITKWNEAAPSINNLDQAHKMKENFGIVTIYKEETPETSKEITVKVDKKLEKVCDLHMNSVSLTLFPNLSVDNLYSERNNLLQEYRIYGKIKDGIHRGKINQGEGEYLTIYDSHYHTVILLGAGEQLTKQQIEFLKWTDRNYLLIRKHRHIKLGNYSRGHWYTKECYRGILDLDKKPKSEWRNLIKEYQSFVKTYTENWTTLDTIVPTQEFLGWKEENKKDRKKAKLNTREEITYQTLREPCTTRAKSIFITDDRITLNVSELHTLKHIYVYFHEDRVNEVKDYYELLHQCDFNIKLVMLSDRNYDKMCKLEPIHNWINLDKFWQTKNRRISKFLTYVLLEKVKEKNFRSMNIHDDANTLDNKTYNKFHSLNDKLNKISYYVSDNKILSYIRLYNKNKWLDYNTIESFVLLYSKVNEFNFLGAFNFNYSNKKLVKKFALTLYVKQKKDEKKGLEVYRKYDVKQMIDNFVKEPEPEVVEAPKLEITVEPDITEEAVEEQVDMLIDMEF